MTALTLDLGTSATKAALWAEHELVEIARVDVATRHPSSDRVEQDPNHWWRSVVDACAELRASQPKIYAAIDAIGFSAARETFACFDAGLKAVSPGIVWSDSRAVEETQQLGDPATFRRRTGVILTPSCCAAKMTWVQRHEPDRFRDARWLLSPRDLVLGRLTGVVTTDQTLASRTGLYDLDGTFIGDAAIGDRQPPVVPSVDTRAVANPDLLDLPTGSVAIVGAGDRACEVMGVGASPSVPMVSWGTTANLSIPHPGPIARLPVQGQISRGAVVGFVVEAGLSIAGAALDWLISLTGQPRDELLAAAARVQPGADGLLSFPWLNGARAPWWRPEVRGAFVGLTSAHGPAELARSVIEGVALDIARCVDLLQPNAQALAVAGRGAEDLLWRTVLAAVTGCPVVRHRLDEASSVGARLLVGLARGESIELDDLSPLTGGETPPPDLVQAYSTVREESDRMATQLMDSGP